MLINFKGGNVPSSLMPTFNNVSTNFITTAMFDILFDKETPNFIFIFREPEAIEFIKKVLNKYIAKYDYFTDNAKKIVEVLEKKNEGNKKKPALIINDYKTFFELLRQYYEKIIELYFIRTKNSQFASYEMENCFKEIWLRATPEDFNNPEEFLMKNVSFVNDTTFSEYNEETFIGTSASFNDNIICVKNCRSRTWDETDQEFEITIYDKDFYNNPEANNRMCYKLPVIRYGIYEKDGRKICYIGSIHNKPNNINSNKISKQFMRYRYKINQGVFDSESEEYKNYISNNDKNNYHPENISEVEPSNVLALSIFINFLHQKGISDIEVPGMYVIDYEYHEKMNNLILKAFKEKWTKSAIKEFQSDYENDKLILQGILNKQDLISENKTERFIRTFMRIMYHYPNSQLRQYPGDVGNYLRINIPVVESQYDIRGDIMREMYGIVNQAHGNFKKNN